MVYRAFRVDYDSLHALASSTGDVRTDRHDCVSGSKTCSHVNCGAYKLAGFPPPRSPHRKTSLIGFSKRGDYCF